MAYLHDCTSVLRAQYISEMLFISLHCGMLVWVHHDALIIIARVLYDVYCWNLLIVNIICASRDCHNFVPADAMMMILICTCSTLHALHVIVLCIHVRVHIDILTPVAKCMLLLTAVNCCKLLICHFCCILCVHPMGMMSTCFKSIFILSL